jgi:hypothetical protein
MSMFRSIPFVLGTSANRSHSIIGNVQEALRQCDTTYATPVTNPPPAPAYVQPRKSSAQLRKSSVSASDQASMSTKIGTSASVLGTGMQGPERALTTLVGSRTKTRISNGNASDVADSSTRARPTAIHIPTASTSCPNPLKVRNGDCVSERIAL